MPPEESGRIVIIGGGFTGAAVAFHLAHLLPAETGEILVVEPRTSLGAGLAYSTAEPAHRINVPAIRMSLIPDEPNHFQDWLEASGALAQDRDAVWARTGAAYPQRALFARYVSSQLDPLLRSGRVRHLRAIADSAERTPEGWRVGLRGQAAVEADLLVIATTHPPVSTPSPLTAIADASGYICQPYGVGALDAVRADARVLIVGAGLTAADVVATLDRRGHQGPILALSRNGLRSRGHAVGGSAPRGDFSRTPADNVVSLLRRVRAEIRAANGQGVSWHGILDAVREQGGTIWAALPAAERRKLVRHLRAFWDVHRFRVAPQVEAVLERRAEAGLFHNIAARLVSSRSQSDGLEVSFRRRGSTQVESGRFDLVVNTTGPSHRNVLSSTPLLTALARAGHLQGDALGLGIATSERSHALDAQGRAYPTILIAGPLARGTFGELMGLPEVTVHARSVAGEAARYVNACQRMTASLRTAGVG